MINPDNKDNLILPKKEMQVYNVALKTSGNSLVFRGTIDDSNPGSYLAPFLNEIYTLIVKKKIPAFSIDIRELHYINSSGIKELISWLLKFNNRESNGKYSITFICSKESRWHGSSVSMIQKIINDNIFIAFR